MDTVLGAKQSRGEGREEHPDLPTPCRDPPAGLHEKGAETEELDGGMPSADETGQEGHAGANEPTSSRGPNGSTSVCLFKKAPAALTSADDGGAHPVSPHRQAMQN